MKNSKNNKESIYGIIIGHGAREDNMDCVVIPKGIKIKVLSSNGKDLVIGHDFSKKINFSRDDYDLIWTASMRRLTWNSCELSEDEKIFSEGDVIPDIKISFKNVYPDKTFGSGGIVTTCYIHKYSLPIENRKDKDLMESILHAHDNAIIDKQKLWDKEWNLGDVLKLITKSGKRGNYILFCCRSLIGTDKVPKWSTKQQKLEDSDPYFNRFDKKVYWLKNLNNNNAINTLLLEDNKFKTKFKTRIFLRSFYEQIMIKYNTGFTITMEEFYGLNEIFYNKKVPSLLIKSYIKIGFYNLSKSLSNIDPTVIKFEENILKNDNDSKKEWWMTLKKVVHITNEYFETLVNADFKGKLSSVDNVMRIAEKIVDGETITEKNQKLIIYLNKKYCNKFYLN